jgi:hypothetical protein
MVPSLTMPKPGMKANPIIPPELKVCGIVLEFDILLKLLAFTDLDDPWTSASTYASAQEILSRHTQQLQTHDFIINYVLKGFIRPLFSKSTPASVTPQGRKVIYPVAENPHHHTDLDLSSKPWKTEEISAVTILGWAVRQSDVCSSTSVINTVFDSPY